MEGIRRNSQRFASFVALNEGVEVAHIDTPCPAIPILNDGQEAILDEPSELPRGDA